MKKCISLAILLLAAFTSFCQPRKTPKALFIIVDGIPADVIEKLQPPTLMEISKTGGYTRSFTGGIKGGYNQTPTISAPGYINLLTGVWANKHNVWDNDINDPNYNYWNIFRIAEKTNPNLKTAVLSTWTDNRTKLVGEGLEEAGNIKLDYSFDGLELDTIKYPHDKNDDYIRNIDDAVAADAAKIVTEQGPDLSWVYLQYTDDMGHQYGDSDQFYNAILAADKRIGKIWEAITLREKTFDEDWLIVVTTDHGRNAETGKDHGGQSDRERLTWIVTNSHNLNEHFKQTPAVVDILPSVCNHLGIKIPEEVRNELDGTPFIGPLEFTDLKATKEGSKITLEWKSHVKDNRNLAVYICASNKTKRGDPDEYIKVGEVPVKSGKHSFSFGSNSQFFKIVAKTPTQAANTWLGTAPK
ncbi:MAG TPA: alkaline phosphatase family protein [Cyclobacteriaceae bacterium]|nr:alkaline phosphatase family protein [Cyclobacteriaceae bacterium]